MNTTAGYARHVGGKISGVRRALGKDQVSQFAKVYLNDHCPAPWSRMHHELFELLEGACRNRRQRIAVAAPRGHAKSTAVSLAYVLWALLYLREMHILIVSASREQAASLLRVVRHELESNQLLLQDFPEARRNPKLCRETQLILDHGPAVRALGAGQRMRGLKHRQFRPTLIVCDDLEDQVGASSAEGRTKMREWFNRTLLKMAGPDTNVVVVGTVLHHDSLLANLAGLKGEPAAGWSGQVYRAIEAPSVHPELWAEWERVFDGRSTHDGASGKEAAKEYLRVHHDAMHLGSKVLWPEVDSLEQLMLMRLREGTAAFQAEKQNQPLDPAECLFREENFHYWSDKYPDEQQLLRALGPRARIIGALDPSLGRKSHTGDYSAIVTIAEDPETDILYVLNTYINRMGPDSSIQVILYLAAKYQYDRFVIESNGFQEMMVTELERRAERCGNRLSVDEVRNASDKKGRIQSLEPMVARGRIRFHRDQVQLLEQLRDFPLGAHDDGPDALEMAVRTAATKRFTAGWCRT